MMKINF